LAFEGLESRRLLATITVNTTADENVADATLSLREAIEIVNGTLPASALSAQEQAQISGPSATPDTIAFHIPGSGTQTITLGSPLPALAQPVTIDGTTQPGYSPSAPPLIVLDGSKAGAAAVGLTVNAATSVTLQGLTLNSFAKGIDFLAAGAASKLASLAFSGQTTAAIAAEGNLAGSSFADIAILGPVNVGIAVAGNLGTSTFTDIAISGAGGSGISIGGSATGTSYNNVAIALKGGSSNGIRVGGDASNSLFSSIAITGAGLDGVTLGVATNSTFMNMSIAATGHDGLFVAGDATGATYASLAVALNSGSDDGVEVAGDGSSSSYGTISVLNAGVDGIALGKATRSVFSNLAVIGAGHDGLLISGDATSSSFNSLVFVLNSGANTALSVIGDLSKSTVGKVTIAGQGGSPPQFGGGVSVGGAATGTLFGPITVSGKFNFGIAVNGDTSSGQFSNNVIDELAAAASQSVGITARGDSIEVSGNVLVGPLTDGLNFQATTGAVSEVASNVINTQGAGVGVLLQGAAGVQVALGCNNLGGNAVGLKVLGDGTTAGTIDAGGGPLGSTTVMTGMNTFDQTTAAGTLAISLTQTNASATVDAQGNVFADLGAIQDSTHGGGTGTISVSSGTSNCPGTLAILMGTFTVAEGTAYNGPVATYMVYQPVPPGPFSAMITWGDGSMSSGTIAQPGGPGTPFVVSGTHTYAAAGNYSTSVTIVDDTTSYVAPAPGTAVVTDPAPVIMVPPLQATAGVPTGTLAIATFTDPGTPLPVSHYTATIDWGDRTPPVLGVISVSGSVYTVSGGHTYAQPGAYTITVSVQDQDSRPASMTGPATVVGSSTSLATTTQLVSSLNPATAGQAVTFTAIVTPTAGTSTARPTGTVTFAIDGVVQPSVTLTVIGGQEVATFSTASLGIGTHTISAVYSGDSTFAPSTAPALPQDVLAPPPPAVVALARFGFHAQPTVLVLIFSQALDPARAENVAEYQLVTVVKGRHGRLKVGPHIAIATATYDPTNKTVSLRLAKPLSLHKLYQLTVNGTPPTGLTDPYGQFIDGAGNGHAGTNYVKVFGVSILQGPSAIPPG
jgi:CSLREA domain-containing protein